jgi:hypothetical protein
MNEWDMKTMYMVIGGQIMGSQKENWKDLQP